VPAASVGLWQGLTWAVVGGGVGGVTATTKGEKSWTSAYC